MCKIVIKEVHGETKPHTGDGWTRWQLTVTAEIDGEPPVKAIVNTFDEPVLNKILSTSKENPTGPLPIWNAEPFGKTETVSYTIKAAENPDIIPLKKKPRAKSQKPAVKNNRQVALECATRIPHKTSAAIDPSASAVNRTLEAAEIYLRWLEGETLADLKKKNGRE